MKTKWFLALFSAAAIGLPVQAQVCGSGGVISGCAAYPVYAAPPVVYAPVAPAVVYAPPVVYQQPSVVYSVGYGSYGYYPRYSAPIHLSFGFGYYGGSHWSGGHWGGSYWGGGHRGGGYGGGGHWGGGSRGGGHFGHRR